MTDCIITKGIKLLILRTLSQYEKDEWYLERDSNDRVTEVNTPIQWTF